MIHQATEGIPIKDRRKIPERSSGRRSSGVGPAGEYMTIEDYPVVILVLRIYVADIQCGVVVLQ